MTRSELFFSAAVTLVASGLSAVIGIRTAAPHRDGVTTHALTLLDSRNHPIAVLSSEQDSPQLVFFDQQHRKRSALFLEPNGTPDLYLYDSAGKARAALDLYDSGAPNLDLIGASEGVTGPTAILESKTAGNLRFEFYDFRNNTKNTLGRFEFSLVGNRPTLQLLDGSGKRIWGTP